MLELRIAEYLIRRSFKIDGLDVTKGADPVPEFVAATDFLSIAVEVYAPLEWKDVEQSRRRLPARWVVVSPPGPSGYAPEGMFDRLVHRRVRRKAAKGQARVPG